MIWSRTRQLGFYGLGITVGVMLMTLRGDAQIGGGAGAKDINTLLPADTVLYLSSDGSASHQAAWEETAAYESYSGSGLAELVNQAVQFAKDREDFGEQIGEAIEAVSTISKNGGVASISIPTEAGPPLPRLTIVLRKAGQYTPRLVQLLRMAAEEARFDLEQEEIAGREVTHFIIPDSPGVEVGLWNEAGHLIASVGMNAVREAIAVAEGDAANITSNETFKSEAARDVDFEVVGSSWLDIEAIAGIYGQMPIPAPTRDPLEVSDVLEMLGVDHLGTVSTRSGYKGKACWTESYLECENAIEMFGTESPTMTLEDLPPLPTSTTTFAATKFDAARTYDALVKMVRNVTDQIEDPEPGLQVERVIQQLPNFLGFDPRKDLLEALGDVVCVYGDPHGGAYGTGFALAISVDDVDQLQDTFEIIVERLESYDDSPVYPFVAEKYGRYFLTFDVYIEDNSFQVGAIAIDEDWLVIGVMPQAVTSFLLRLDERLPSWEPNAEYAAALEEMPDEFCSISAVDTRDAYRLLLNWGTLVTPFIQTAIYSSDFLADDEELPFHVEDIPPAELIVAPLFPNVGMSVIEEDGVRWFSRTSSPSVPLLGGNDSASSVGAVAVLTALLLPAVQQARAAARRSQSMNNMKQLALSMHNYHDVHQSFPAGTVANEDLKPEERLSWYYNVLPMMEQQWVYNQIDPEKKWNEGDNNEAAFMEIPILWNPNVPQQYDEDGYPVAHYVGIAGVGKDSAKDPKKSENPGVFNYDQGARIRDIVDGTSNTLMHMEVNKNLGPWLQGGDSTVRAFTKQPYINGPDGFGGNFQGGANAGFCDGSVRFISENVDPTVLENLAGYRDGQVVGDF